MGKTVFSKLQWKDEAPVLLLRAPETFDAEAAGLDPSVPRRTTLRGKGPYPFVLAFVRSCAEIEALAPKVAERLEDDGKLWFAYPKRSSKRLTSDIGRDDSWGPVGALGFEGVRQVAVDEDWSALRFRRVEHIGALTREPKRAMTEEGRRRAEGGGLDAVFARLRALVRPYVADLPGLAEGAGSLRANSRDTAPSGAPLEFLSIATRSKSVNLYLMPIYVNPELAADLPEGLAKRRQGKSCFNFPTVDEARFAELDALLARCRTRWEADGRL